VGWLVIAYLGSLAVLFVAAFWHLDEFSGLVVKGFSLENFRTLLDGHVYREIVLRTALIAAAVTVTDALLAFPIAFTMAKLSSSRTRGLLVVAVLMPLWASYLVKVYAWRVILQEDGILNWALGPLVLPSVVAGSIFTFSLTLGDYIAPQLVSSTQFIGNVVYNNVGVANNLPLAAAFATVPVLIMIGYLLGARRLGAFDSL
jgi:putative spermidine/putrescine transport system permease protein